jgi:hypothetical protein
MPLLAYITTTVTSVVYIHDDSECGINPTTSPGSDTQATTTDDLDPSAPLTSAEGAETTPTAAPRTTTVGLATDDPTAPSTATDAANTLESTLAATGVDEGQTLVSTSSVRPSVAPSNLPTGGAGELVVPAVVTLIGGAVAVLLVV